MAFDVRVGRVEPDVRTRRPTGESSRRLPA